MREPCRAASPLTRRQTLQQAAVAAGVAGAVVTSATCRRAPATLKLGQGDTILLQGDLITDAGRDRSEQADANDARAMGWGYALLIGCELLRDHPRTGLKVYNRGISGHKVPDLDERWQEDTIDLQPAVVSILIGGNDIWHKLNGDYDGSVATYETGYRALLETTRVALPHAALVVCEPFVLRCGAVTDEWFPEFDERRAAAARVARDAGTLWVPFQTMFDDAVAAT